MGALEASGGQAGEIQEGKSIGHGGRQQSFVQGNSEACGPRQHDLPRP